MAQYLDIVRVIPVFRELGPSKDMMPFKFFCAFTFFAFTNLFLFLLNYSSNFMLSFCNAAFPIVVIFARRTFYASYSAFGRTKVAGSTASLTSLKRYSAVLASILQHCFGSFLFNFVRTFARTGMSIGANMSIWAHKFATASFANKDCVSSFSNKAHGGSYV